MKLIIFVLIGIVILFVLLKIFKAFLKWIVILLIAFLVFAYFTNPEESKHRQSLNDVLNDLQIKKIKKKFVEVDNYQIFSITKVTVDGKERIVGVGAFGKVWYFDKIKEKLTKKKE
jgi:uncharacterized protein YacL